VSHKRLIKDAAASMQVSEHSVFVNALILKRGLDCSHIIEVATSMYNNFLATGKAPEFVQDFALTRIQARRRVLAKRKAKIKQDSCVSLVDALDDRCPEQLGQAKLFDEDKA